jgi:hypothetical protein
MKEPQFLLRLITAALFPARERKKQIRFTLLAIIFLCLGSCYTAIAQDAPVAQSDQITKDGEIIQDDDTSTGTFESVTVDQFTTSAIALQFPASLTNKSVAIEALDGGTLDSNSATIASDGSLAFSFQVSDQSGVYRVVVIDPNADEDAPHIIGMVQFEVPSPEE